MKVDDSLPIIAALNQAQANFNRVVKNFRELFDFSNEFKQVNQTLVQLNQATQINKDAVLNYFNQLYQNGIGIFNREMNKGIAGFERWFEQFDIRELPLFEAINQKINQVAPAMEKVTKGVNRVISGLERVGKIKFFGSLGEKALEFAGKLKNVQSILSYFPRIKSFFSGEGGDFSSFTDFLVRKKDDLVGFAQEMQQTIVSKLRELNSRAAQNIADFIDKANGKSRELLAKVSEKVNYFYGKVQDFSGRALQGINKFSQTGLHYFDKFKGGVEKTFKVLDKVQTGLAKGFPTVQKISKALGWDGLPAFYQKVQQKLATGTAKLSGAMTKVIGGVSKGFSMLGELSKGNISAVFGQLGEKIQGTEIFQNVKNFIEPVGQVLGGFFGPQQPDLIGSALGSLGSLPGFVDSVNTVSSSIYNNQASSNPVTNNSQVVNMTVNSDDPNRIIDAINKSFNQRDSATHNNSLSSIAL